LASAHPFDPGPVEEPFASLARDYPGADAYPPELFRVEWGPIFHRGRLDGSAKVLIVGQDPGQHESIGRRCMVGEAGQRVQGFLRKLGITESYTIVNAYLYSVFGQPSHKEVLAVEPAVAPYRGKWFDALLLHSGVQAVVAFGDLAHAAFEAWRGPEADPKVDVEYAPLLHPTYPEGSKAPGAMKKMLDQWNAALPGLRSAVSSPDVAPDTTPYGDDLLPSDRAQIPEGDLPAGSPPWMRSLKTWASREDLLAKDAPKPKKDEAKRATIVVRVPLDERPWKPLDQ
jgi:uracil-DNA glycosylase